MNTLKKILVFIFVFSTLTAGQKIPLNKYGLPVVEDIALYDKLARKDSLKKLVDIEKIIPGIVLDVKYAAENNFTGRQLYPFPKVFLRRSAALALLEVQKELNSIKLGLKIFDGYRPYHVTELMFEVVKNADYAANPAKGSRHNRGCAVDLTLIDLAAGEELPMPTKYDEFTIKAHHDYKELPEEILKNRELLKNVMVKFGFIPYEAEWWHYDFAGWSRYELLDISFGDLVTKSNYVK